MEIEIIEKQNQSLVAYKDGELLFYSTIKFSLLKKNLITIFDSNDNLIIELRSYDAPFKSLKLEILSQDIDVTEKISEISKNEIIFNQNKKLKIQKEDFFSFNQNCFYLYEGVR
ncbi:MAG: hypothetical protein WAM46_03615, partial [Flavobacterium sp.]